MPLNVNVIVAATRDYGTNGGACDVRGCGGTPAFRLRMRAPAAAAPLRPSCDALAYVTVAAHPTHGGFRPMHVCEGCLPRALQDFGKPGFFEQMVRSLIADGQMPAGTSYCRLEPDPLPTSN